jgi:glycosyltransferase involved in cell wall biosynthesis
LRQLWRERLPANVQRRLLWDSVAPRYAALFHGLNQRLPEWRARRMVSTFHDLFVMTGEYSTPEFRRRFTEQARFAASRSDLIITVSAFTASQVSALLGVETPRIRVIHHGVRAPSNVPTDEQREDIVLSVGAVQVRKNVDRLVEAFERLPESWRLVLAGGQGYGFERIRERIERSPARARIQIAGYVDRAALESLYSRARILAFPSLDEGFGIPVLEAMAWGVPVLTANRSALPEVAGSAALLVDPLNTEEIAAALSVLAEDSELRQRLAELGRERAASFRWEDAVTRTWGVYQELIG